MQGTVNVPSMSARAMLRLIHCSGASGLCPSASDAQRCTDVGLHCIQIELAHDSMLHAHSPKLEPAVHRVNSFAESAWGASGGQQPNEWLTHQIPLLEQQAWRPPAWSAFLTPWHAAASAAAPSAMSTCWLRATTADAEPVSRAVLASKFETTASGPRANQSKLSSDCNATSDVCDVNLCTECCAGGCIHDSLGPQSASRRPRQRRPASACRLRLQLYTSSARCA